MSLKSAKIGINTISIAVPIVVAILLSIQNKLDFGQWTKSLPHVIGIVNSLTTLALIGGFVAIRKGSVIWHRIMMGLSFLLGGVFLVSYVVYHMTNASKVFSGDGIVKPIYLAVLFSHIVLSIAVLPLVLRALYWALAEDFIRHRRIARFAFPIWLYVSATGVSVYVLNHLVYP